jgi:hypothetical protein
MQLHVCRTNLLKAMLHNLEGQFRFVAITADVAKVKMMKIVRHDVCRAIGGGFV